MNSPVARLEVVSGKATGMSIVVEDELLIGRHADGAGRLAEDDEISRSHARLSLDGAGFCAIEDLGSTNGTFVNGLRISTPQTLSEGDSIEVGGTTLVVRQLPVPATAQARRAVVPQPTLTPGEATTAAKPPLQEPPTTVHVRASASEKRDLPPGQGEPPPGHSDAVLALQLEVDLGSGRVTIALGDGSHPLRLVLENGAWRPASD